MPDLDANVIAESLDGDLEQLSEFTTRMWCAEDLQEIRELLRHGLDAVNALIERS